MICEEFVLVTIFLRNLTLKLRKAHSFGDGADLVFASTSYCNDQTFQARPNCDKSRLLGEVLRAQATVELLLSECRQWKLRK